MYYLNVEWGFCCIRAQCWRFKPMWRDFCHLFFLSFSTGMLFYVECLLVWIFAVINAFRNVMLQQGLTFSPYLQQSAHSGIDCCSISDSCSLAVQFSPGIALQCHFHSFFFAFSFSFFCVIR